MIALISDMKKICILSYDFSIHNFLQLIISNTIKLNLLINFITNTLYLFKFLRGFHIDLGSILKLICSIIFIRKIVTVVNECT